MVKIEKLTAENMRLVRLQGAQIDIIGRIVPEYIGGQWHYAEEPAENPGQKAYPDADMADYAACIEGADRAAFLAIAGGAWAGQILVRRDWNGYGWVEDIQVDGEKRGCGIGTLLLRSAENWAKEAGMHGIGLETQDNNVLACRFYAKNGFAVGGLNTRLYRHCGAQISDEKAIYWYKEFAE